MSKKIRNRFTAQEKVAVLRLHLLEHPPIRSGSPDGATKGLALKRETDDEVAQSSARSQSRYWPKDCGSEKSAE